MVLEISKEIADVMSHQREAPALRESSPLALRSSPDFPLLTEPGQRAAAEYFGVLRARLLKAQSKSALRSVLISSPQQQDGKSFTSVNLAISLAQLQQLRVLLIDGDMRVRGATRGLGLEQQIGLADFLQDCATFEESIRSTVLSHLYVAPAGNVIGESLPGILQGKKWLEFIQKSSQNFDLVIVDSVPVSAPIADFELLLNACDAALLVVHIRKTRREALQAVTNQMHGKLLGVIVNNQQLQSDFGYGYNGAKGR
jgi:receptor protein-tyrosine kinase